MRQPLPAGSSVRALDSLVQKVSELELEVLAGRVTGLDGLSALLTNLFRETGRNVLECLLSQAALAEPSHRTCGCGARQSSTGFETRTFTCRPGTLRVERRRLTCPSCGASGHPFDSAWGLPSGHYSTAIREALTRLSCRLPHREACLELSHLFGISLGITTSKRWCDMEGERAAAQARKEAKESWSAYEQEQFDVAAGEQRARERAPGFGAIEVDGVHVLTWKPGQEPRRGAPQEPLPAADPMTQARSETEPPAQEAPAPAGRREHHAPSTLSSIIGSPMGPRARSPRVAGRELCVGLVYLDADRAEESPGRGVLLNRTYVTTLNDRPEFWKELHAAARGMGALDRQALIHLSDGALYFITQSQELFRDQPLVTITDIQHARQHLWEAAHAATATREERQACVQPLLDQLDRGDTTGVLEGLAALRESVPTIKERKAIDAQRVYIENHKDSMRYPQFRAAGYPVATGGVESANKRLVGRRCKQGGMIWSEVGLENMRALRTAFMNERPWQRMWPQQHEQRAAA